MTPKGANFNLTIIDICFGWCREGRERAQKCSYCGGFMTIYEGKKKVFCVYVLIFAINIICLFKQYITLLSILLDWLINDFYRAFDRLIFLLSSPVVLFWQISQHKFVNTQICSHNTRESTKNDHSSIKYWWHTSEHTSKKTSILLSKLS